LLNWTDSLTDTAGKIQFVSNSTMKLAPFDESGP